MGISTDIYEDSFVNSAIPSYNLSALVGADRFSFCAYDEDQQKVHLLKSYNFPNTSIKEIKSIVHEVYTQDELLKSNFRKSTIAVLNSKMTLVPLRLYDENQKEAYLEKQIVSNENDAILIDDLPDLGIKNIYAIDEGLKSILHSYFPSADIFHGATLFINGAKELSKHRSGFQLYLNVIGQSFQIVLFEDQDLLCSNFYSFKSSNDFIYFTMLIFDQFKLKPEAVPLYLSGQIAQDSEIYKLIYRYIRHIHFIQLPTFLNFGPQLKSLTEHHYFNLYCSKICE